jgi:hypothetical protein
MVATLAASHPQQTSVVAGRTGRFRPVADVTPEGFLLSPYNPETARQLEAADLIMREDRDVLRELAK